MTGLFRSLIKRTNSFHTAIATIMALPLIFNSAMAAKADENRPHFCGPYNPPEARSVETIIPALYSVVSGAAGSDKNWSLLEQLFAPQAMVTPVFHSEEGGVLAQIMTVGEFIALNKEIFKDQNFFESEVDSQVFQFGHMANVLSHYVSRKAPDAEPYAQGVNSFQLLNDGRRWCVLSVTWDSDQKTHPIMTNMFK